ncbi:VOC family protein [Litorilinea aerophila]|uniref:VOC family protein n=1 Tax=Litorilinea aerophila TaxID=1204385 RepID=A0A540V8W1_9CHLR|nr:VOC family protein [Litorilinea aerophila]MCC9078921.1 VOC family protein [Litorilinea aerophila]
MKPEQTPSGRIHLGPVVQVGIVVRDVEATLRAWMERFHLPPARIVDWPPEGTDLAATATYRGGPGRFRMRLAFVETGPVQLEFIQPLEGENIYSEFLAEHGEGIHHLLFEVDDPEAVAAGLEVPILQSGGSTLRPGALWAYLDTQALLGAMIELRTRQESASESFGDPAGAP